MQAYALLDQLTTAAGPLHTCIRHGSTQFNKLIGGTANVVGMGESPHTWLLLAIWVVHHARRRVTAHAVTQPAACTLG